MKKRTRNLTLAIVFIVLISGYYFSIQPGKYDDFAKCLTKEEIKFYGAFWCPHCADQKKLFGKSMEFITYIECSTPDRNDMTPLCKQEEIKGYPTWKFKDGSSVSGFVNFKDLEHPKTKEFLEKTNCKL